MGLDMYLVAKKYMYTYNEDHPDYEMAKQVTEALGLDFKDTPVKEVSIDAMYWRKANAIHNWFVQECQEGVDDCRESWVSRESLEKLLALCRKALAQPVMAGEVLPTKNGFFFGSTELDEWYFQAMTDTVKQLEKLLKMPKEWDFYYRASW